MGVGGGGGGLRVPVEGVTQKCSFRVLGMKFNFIQSVEVNEANIKSADQHTHGQQAREKMLTSLIISEMQIKSPVSRLSVRTTIVKKKRDDKCCQGSGEEENSCNVGGNISGVTTMENSVSFPQKSKNYHTIQQSYFQGEIQRKQKLDLEDLHPCVH